MLIVQLAIIIGQMVSFTFNNETVMYNTYMPATNVYTKSKDMNALYAASESFIVYRVNYTRRLMSPSFNYQSTHTRRIRDIAVSYGQRYVATGGQDNQVQVVQIYPKTTKCTFFCNNQVRALTFHPNFEEILFVGVLDDGIQKWNVTSCKQMGSLAVGGIVTAMVLNLDGSQVYYGTFEGHVGKADEALTTYSIYTNAHRFMVRYMFTIYHNHYISIGQDSRMVLWDTGTLVDNYTTLASSMIINCFPFGKQVDKELFTLVGCLSTNYKLFTYRVDNNSISLFTSHGVYDYVTPLNWIDSRTFSYDQQTWAYHYGNTILLHKVRMNSSTFCTPHMGYDQVQRTCRFCGYINPGCHFCDNEFTCTFCGQGTYIDNNDKCSRCPLSCTSCSSANFCGTCAVGFYKSGGECRTENYQEGCFEYSGANNCAIVASGYYRTSGSKSRKCSLALEGCVQCTKGSTPACIACNTGYFPNSTFCSLCSDFMPGCRACNNRNTCINCTVAFKYNGPYVQCGDCHYSCETCSGFYDQCVTCAVESNRTLFFDKCPCDPGFYDNGIAKCRSCSQDLGYCYECTNNTICITCHTNYYFVMVGAKRQCAMCVAHCQTCSGLSTNCTSCNQIAYHRVLQSFDCVCEDGFYNPAGSIPCIACSALMEGCSDCDNQQFCTVCSIGFYLDIIDATTQHCQACPYYCPDCSLVAGDVVCNSCPTDSRRTLDAGMCACNVGFFDDNRTVVCQPCGDAITNCIECQNRTKCQVCAPGMMTDAAKTICSPCMDTCLECGTYFDICITCDPWQNRVLVGDKCVCQGSSFEVDGVCSSCASLMPNCNSCANSVVCTGCLPGYILMENLKGCINCEEQINGCQTCTSPFKCTGCKPGFTLINGGCRCDMDRYTSYQDWGTCRTYPIEGLKSGLGIEIRAFQHIHNELIVYIRFRAQDLYILNLEAKESLRLWINGFPKPFNLTSINNNKLTLSTPITSEMKDVNISVTFIEGIFFNEDMLTLSEQSYNSSIRRTYINTQEELKSFKTGSDVLYYFFYVLKWVFLAVTIIGQGHLLFQCVTFIQIMPVFLMIDLALPGLLKMVLDSMLTFQNESIIPMFTISSDFVVQFPPIVYNYYGFFDLILIAKFGDILLLFFIFVITKFDDGIVRMFPIGTVRRHVYESLVMRGYSTMSFTVLSFQPSFILLAGVYLSYTYFENRLQIFNFCCCVFIFGFYLAYNFNHASNLNQSKQMRNIDDRHCFLLMNPQHPSTPKVVLLGLATDFWLVGALHLMPPMVYFIVSLAFLLIRLLAQLQTFLFMGKIQLTLRLLENLCLLSIFAIMFVFLLGQKKIQLEHQVCYNLAIITTALIFGYILLVIAEKIIVYLKVETDYVRTKVVKGKNGQVTVFDTKDQKLDPTRFYNNEGEIARDFLSAGPHNNRFRAMHQDSVSGADSQYDSVPFFQGITRRGANIPTMNSININTRTGFMGTRSRIGSEEQDPNFKNQRPGINTSKYAKNHLELRYVAQSALTKDRQKQKKFDQQ